MMLTTKIRDLFQAFIANIAKRSKLVSLLSCCLLLSACQHSELEQRYDHSPSTTDLGVNHDLENTALPKQYYDVTIESFDGTRIRATVYQPELAADKFAPLVIHSHSFSTFRMSQPLSIYGTFMFAGKTALQLWDQGYWVISFDQRGHGDSEGLIQLMSLEHEIRDASSIIDWASVHLPRILSVEGDTKIGMLGESYSGSMQLLASTQDSRIDAIVPIHTWYDLKHSLSPNQVPKGWLTTLIVAGNGLNPFNLDPKINAGYTEAVEKGAFSDKFADMLEERSFKTACEAGKMPQADAFLMQGFRDSLFNLNQGMGIRDCFNRANRDVRFLATQKGHVLPFAQQDGWMPFHDVEPKVQCGNGTYDTQKMVIDWFDEKLKGQINQADYIPEVCLTVEDDMGLVTNEIPIGGHTYEFTDLKVHSGFAGLLEWPFLPFDLLQNFLTLKSSAPSADSAQSQSNQQTGGRFRPAFVPLLTTEQSTTLLGIPKLQVTLHANDDQGDQLVEQDDAKNMPRVFIGLGIIEPGKAVFRLISKQVTPIEGAGVHDILLAGVSEHIPALSQVGLVVYAYNNQYRFSYSGIATSARLSGTIGLPLMNDEVDFATINEPSALAL